MHSIKTCKQIAFVYAKQWHAALAACVQITYARGIKPCTQITFVHTKRWRVALNACMQIAYARKKQMRSIETCMQITRAHAKARMRSINHMHATRMCAQETNAQH